MNLGRPSLHFVKNHPGKFPWWTKVALCAALDSGHVAGGSLRCLHRGAGWFRGIGTVIGTTAIVVLTA
jgi:hypothetical protein